MKRRSILSGSWYPDNSEEIYANLNSWTVDLDFDPELYAAIVPHAGWYYSGRISARVVKKVCPHKDLVVVIGGHLPPGSEIIAALEGEIETPLGNLINRIDQIKELKSNIPIGKDLFQDNTVEVVLPMIKALSPEADIMWLRAPADSKSIYLGESLFNLSEDNNINMTVLGSTDLTHYGRNYNYSPEGEGLAALKWVKEVNDADLINLLLEFELEDAIKHAFDNKSACSIGAAVAAARFAQMKGSGGGRLMDYKTSYDISPAESFVGYAGIVY